MSAKSIFAVGIAGVGLQSGVVYLDLASLSIDKRDEKGKPAREVALRVYLTTEATMEAYQYLKGALDRLTEMGVLTKKDADGQPELGEDDGAAGAVQGPRSPNFSDS
ncbi:MAG: hypothetical protein K9K66_13710 [Desulfarculaceae bacterium]|nr:hypothetical protein [Desulfarculaceae bacterium]MCF8074453.1 hypothetical protein [Desulfarculaceae bacterium]MCF8102707.1 hypothetical protein [Desulfarculaceae bacterium]MCF8116438.1 hypothetical protein [Desulfarculaceae bacterium]